MTHGPPLGRGDLTVRHERAGCFDLLSHVQDRIRPRVHIYGHIHEGAGVTYDGQTLFVNASSVDLGYRVVEHPVIVDVPRDPSLPARVVQPNYDHFVLDQIPDWLRVNDFSPLAELWDAQSLGDLTIRQMLSVDGLQHVFKVLPGLQRRTDLHPMLQTALSELYKQSFEV